MLLFVSFWFLFACVGCQNTCCGVLVVDGKSFFSFDRIFDVPLFLQVSLAAFLPPLDAADQKSVEARYLLKGKTSVMDLSKTKCSVEAFSEVKVLDCC